MSASENILNNPKFWVQRTLSELGVGLYERDNTLALTLLTVLSGQSVFLYGPPGTAKSLIARRISCIFEDANYFEYLMQRFSTPEDVFGPVSISELKNDNYLRKTENYLPTADIAFLDEIWKSSPAILNTLLTIINERKFKNGSKVENAPLKALIAASNEFPAQNNGLDALYDRFIVRLCVNPMSERDSFEQMISDNNVDSFVKVTEQLSTEEWSDLISAANNVHLTSDVLDCINLIREKIRNYNSIKGVTPVYVSDRRWQKAVFVMKTASLLSGRGSASVSDVLILKNCLWSDPENKPILDSFVDEAVSKLAGGMSDKHAKWLEDYLKLEKEALEVCRPTSKHYKEPVVINDIGCYPLVLSNGPNGMEYTVYVPFGPKKIGERYTAFGKEGSRGRTQYPFKVLSNDSVEATIQFDSDSNVHTIPLDINQKQVPADTVFTFRRALANSIAMLDGNLDYMKYTLSEKHEEFNSPFIDEKDMVRIIDILKKEISAMESDMARAVKLKEYLDSYAR